MSKSRISCSFLFYSECIKDVVAENKQSGNIAGSFTAGAGSIDVECLRIWSGDKRAFYQAAPFNSVCRYSEKLTPHILLKNLLK